MARLFEQNKVQALLMRGKLREIVSIVTASENASIVFDTEVKDTCKHTLPHPTATCKQPEMKLQQHCRVQNPEMRKRWYHR